MGLFFLFLIGLFFIHINSFSNVHIDISCMVSHSFTILNKVYSKCYVCQLQGFNLGFLFQSKSEKQGNSEKQSFDELALA